MSPWWPAARDRIEALAAELSAAAVRTLVIEADVTDRAQAEGRCSVRRRARPARHLVNNAGVMLLGPVADAPVEEWEQMVQVNVLGLLYCAKAALPHLLAPPRAIRAGSPTWSTSPRSPAARSALGSGVYNATKHAVGAFSESLRQEVTQRHVRVALIEPGAVDTELPGTTGPRSWRA